MSGERTEAIVLRGVDFSETSRVVTLFCPERGRMACLAKGARRRGSPLAGALDTFNRVDVVYYWKASRSVQQMAECSVIDAFAGIKSDLSKSMFATFPLEIVSKVAHENEPSQELYAVLTRGLESLDRWTGDARFHACWLAYRLLAAAGFEPSVERCCFTGEPVSGSRPGFSYAGGVTVQSDRNDRRLSEEGYAALTAMAASRETCPDAEAGQETFEVLARYAAFQLDTKFRSVRVIAEMSG